ncbi:MAG: hypothetical protein ACT4QA_15690 [Panacagrimonas sp.]
MSVDLLSREAVLAAMERHVGADAGITGAGLVLEICGLYATKAAERQLRKVIEELRRAGHHVCGHPSEGYYIAASDDELLRTCEFLHDRAMTTLAQVAAMRRVSLPDLRGQLRLRT